MIRKGSYKFSDKTHPVRGVISTLLGITGILSLVALFITSGLQGGQGGGVLGGIGLLVFAVSILGFTLAILSLKEKEIHYSFSVVGASLNGGLLILCFILYVLGASA